MSLGTFFKIFLLLIWPVLFLAISYFRDKEKFKQRLKQFKLKDW